MLAVRWISLLPLVIIQLWLSLAPAFCSTSSNEPESDVPDAFKIFAGFPDAVGVRDVNPDPRFKCLSASRTEFDPVTPSATYRWSLNVDGEEQERYPLLEFTKGSTPDRAHTTVNSDYSHPKRSRFLYSDYAICGVLETNFFGYQCTLFVVPESKDSVPSSCLEAHADLCGEGVNLYDKDICSGTQP